jgi:hypothetical protein
LIEAVKKGVYPPQKFLSKRYTVRSVKRLSELTVSELWKEIKVSEEDLWRDLKVEV